MKISIIVPVYNVEKYIDQCIQSLVNQSYKDMEIILVDDGSEDESLMICQNWAIKDSRIRIITQKNQGVSVARNSGMNSSSGEWICFVDGDDWMEPDAIESMIACVDDNVDLLITDYYADTNKGSEPNAFFSLSDYDFTRADKVELLKNCIIRTSFANKKSVTTAGVPWGKLYRVSFLKENGFFFPVGLKKMQDIVFNIEVMQNCERILYRKIRTYHYRLNMESVCNRYNPLYEEVSARVLDEFHKFIKKYEYEDELIPVWNTLRFMFSLGKIKFMYILNPTNFPLKEQIKCSRNLLRQYQYTRQVQKDMWRYLSTEYKLAFVLCKMHAYDLVYVMFSIYLYLRMRKLM